jgi:hypothetical protein
MYFNGAKLNDIHVDRLQSVVDYPSLSEWYSYFEKIFAIFGTFLDRKENSKNILEKGFVYILIGYCNT